ncbi:MAG: hypothetical protein AAB215_07860 [Planctomycetota bacterium]
MLQTWAYTPHIGGRRIPQDVRERTRNRILAFARKRYHGKYTRIDVRFRGQFCYVDAYVEPRVLSRFNAKAYGTSREEYIERLRNTPVHLCRLRFFSSEERWTLGYYSYGSDKYEPSVFKNGTFEGTPEEGFEASAGHLRVAN